jgi:hypothetical protein
MSDDLVKRLRYCAPERRDCGRNELAMLDAADRIEQLEAALREIASIDSYYVSDIVDFARKALEWKDD